MTVQNFREITELLRIGKKLNPTNKDMARVVQRGLEKKAPLHQKKNSVADALLIELYNSAVKRIEIDGKSILLCDIELSRFLLYQTGTARLPHPILQKSSPMIALATSTGKMN